MTLEKISDIYEDFRNALARLQEALNEDLLKGNIIIDGTIQRFEFLFELSWKLTKSILNYNGIEAESPRMAIKEAFKTGIIKDGEDWINMLGDRNKTSHIYDEKQALSIYKGIKDIHFKRLKDFDNSIAKFINKIEK